MTLIFGALAAIVLIFFAFALVFSQFVPRKVCAICAAVLLTWTGLLVGYFLGWHSDGLIIGILMGGSVVGIMQRAVKHFQDKRLTNLWALRLYIVVVGFLAVYLLLSGRYDSLVTLAVFAVIVGFLGLFFAKPRPGNEAASEAPGLGRTLKEKLERCCD